MRKFFIVETQFRSLEDLWPVFQSWLLFNYTVRIKRVQGSSIEGDSLGDRV